MRLVHTSDVIFVSKWIFAVVAIASFNPCNAQLTDSDVERLKRQSAAQNRVPAIDAFDDAKTYDECVQRARSLGVIHGAINGVCASRLPIAEIKLCDRPLTLSESSEGKVTRVQVDCQSKKDLAVWYRPSRPDINYVPVPNGWPDSTGVMYSRYTWRVHTRSRNQEKKGTFTPDLASDSNYVPCAARVTRISDVGNGNKWRAKFYALNPRNPESRAGLRLQFLLKPRNWRTDSDLAAQTFLIEVYSLEKTSWREMWQELESPTSRPSVMSMFWKNNIQCAHWSAGNDSFVREPKQPRQREPEVVNPFQTIPSPTVWATGEVRCNNGDSTFSAYVRQAADGPTCDAAKAEVRRYFSTIDRCRYQEKRIEPSWSAYPGIRWIQTGNCY